MTLRALKPNESARAQQALKEVRLDGIPNYFDDQRFGSVAEEGQFVARSIILGRYEEALQPLARAVELKPNSAKFQNNGCQRGA